jgi:SRSO17 transposase
MTLKREPVELVSFVDQYCSFFQDLFADDVRNYECFKYLHLGLISELPRKSLPAIARAVGLEDSQPLHHFIAQALWDVTDLRVRRLERIKKALQGRTIILCIDETGDRKKGETTDYVARQYIGNLGKIDNGIVSVNAYAVVDGITFPLLFKVYQPQTRLRKAEQYKTKPELAVEIIGELKQLGFKFSVVLADSLYGESSDFIGGLNEFKLKYVLAIRSDHGMWLPAEQEIWYTRWKEFDRVFFNGEQELRSIAEVVYGVRRSVRYYLITTDKEKLPSESTWFVLTNLEGNIQKQVGNTYGMRTWIEYGFKQCKDELGWADYRLSGLCEYRALVGDRLKRLFDGELTDRDIQR